MLFLFLRRNTEFIFPVAFNLRLVFAYFVFFGVGKNRSVQKIAKVGKRKFYLEIPIQSIRVLNLKENQSIVENWWRAARVQNGEEKRCREVPLFLRNLLRHRLCWNRGPDSRNFVDRSLFGFGKLLWFLIKTVPVNCSYCFRRAKRSWPRRLRTIWRIRRATGNPDKKRHFHS